MPEETINDIFTLSTSRYSEVRTFAQELLIKLMARYFSFAIPVKSFDLFVDHYY